MEFDNVTFQEFKDLFRKETGKVAEGENFDTFLRYVQAHQSIILAQSLTKLTASIADIGNKLDTLIDNR